MARADRFHSTPGAYFTTHVHLATGAIMHEAKVGQGSAYSWECTTPGKCRQAHLANYPALTRTKNARVRLVDVGLGLTIWISDGTTWRPESDIWCNGTPEGQITAPVGSKANRLDGSAGTGSYVKESGTGNTGWVAK